MYESYFSFKQAPFSIAPDPNFLYPSPQHKKGLEQLIYGLKKEGGFIVLTGEVGTGKTTLCRLFLSNIKDDVVSATIFNSKLDSIELLRHIANTLGVDDSASKSNYQISDAIEAQLIKNHQLGKKTLLVIEESQNLSPDTLETLRLLTNFETNTEKLIHILLIGQPELVTTLNRPDLRQLNQRVIARFHFRPLSEEETEHYIVHRLSVVGGQQQVFKKSSIKALYKYSQGVPRLINLLADKALQLTYENNQKFVSPESVASADEHIHGKQQALQPQPKRLFHWPKLYLAIASMAIVIGLVSIALISINHFNDMAGGIQPSAHQATTTTTAISDAEPTPPLPEEQHQVQSATTTPAAKVLLTLWQIDTKQTVTTDISLSNLCAFIPRYDLDCFTLSPASLTQLETTNRPAIVTMFNSHGLAEQQLLVRIANDQLTLHGPNGEQHMSLREFEQRWRGDALIVWRPAPGFIDTVRVGDRSFQTVSWLQKALQDLNYIDGKMITGGSYSQVLADTVKQFQRDHGLSPDGSLGKNTIIAINSALNQSPLLISADQSPKSR